MSCSYDNTVSRAPDRKIIVNLTRTRTTSFVLYSNHALDKTCLVVVVVNMSLLTTLLNCYTIGTLTAILILSSDDLEKRKGQKRGGERKKRAWRQEKRISSLILPPLSPDIS